MVRFLFLFIFIINIASTKAQLTYNVSSLQLGTIAEANEIKGDLILKNDASKKIFLMRADSELGVKIYASKKTLQPNDTCLLVISFIPNETGKFSKKIKLITSDAEKPYLLELQGKLEKLTTDNKMACFYFGSQKRSNVKVKDEPIVIKEPTTPRDNSNKIPDNSSQPNPTTVVATSPSIVTTSIPTKTIASTNTTNINPNEISNSEYKPNNIVFLIDVSNSMKDSLKFPAMKKALHVLIDAIREVDYITLITYADTVKVIQEKISGKNKTVLHAMVTLMKAKGQTKGNKAILKAQQVTQDGYIIGGNNQIFLCTDGKFSFHEKDQTKFKQNQGAKPIVLSTVAFGKDKEAMLNLKDISKLGNGSFIHIKNTASDTDKLLEEVKLRSKI